MTFELGRPSGPIASRSKLNLVHSSIGLGSIVGCMLVVRATGSFLKANDAFTSPVLPVLVATELLRLAINQRWLNIVADVKLVTLPGQNLAPRPTVRRNVPVLVFRTALLLAVGFACAFALCVIFGAPVFTSHGESAMLSGVIVATTLLPLTLFTGPLGVLQFLFCDQFHMVHRSQTEYLQLVHRHAMCALFGAWSASACNVLDWDRDWQTYPIPNVYGALAGLFAGNLVTLADELWRLSGVRFDVLSYLPDEDGPPTKQPNGSAQQHSIAMNGKRCD